MHLINGTLCAIIALFTAIQATVSDVDFILAGLIPVIAIAMLLAGANFTLFVIQDWLPILSEEDNYGDYEDYDPLPQSAFKPHS